MNIGTIDNYIYEIKELQEKINLEVERAIFAKKKTEEFLATCYGHGLRKVSISKSHKSIKESVNFPFSPSGSVFGIGINKSRSTKTSGHGWPAIWGAVRDHDYCGGAGNSNQHQLNNKANNELIDGVYHFKKGAWSKIDK